MKRIFFILGVVFLIILVCTTIFLKVTSVSCKSQDNTSCTRDVSDVTQSVKGKRLIFANREVTNLLSQKTEIEKFTVTTSPFGNLSVIVTMRSADIALKPSNDSSYTLYTKNGIVVGQATETTTPFVELKEQVDSGDLPFLAILSYQLTNILPVSKMSVEGSKLIVELRDGRICFYPLDGDIDVLLGATLATFSQLNLSDGKLIIDRQAVAIHEIDFRFKNPVLR